MSTQNTSVPQSEPEWLQITEKHVASLRFGSVQLIVHESNVVEIETTEKVRFDKANSSSGSRK